MVTYMKLSTWNLHLVFADRGRTSYVSSISHFTDLNKHREIGSPHFSDTIRKASYQQSKADYSLFTKTQGTSFTVILIYVDDILLTGNDLYEMEWLKEFLFKHFRIKDLGTFKYFLSIEFSRSKQGTFMSQRSMH